MAGALTGGSAPARRSASASSTTIRWSGRGPRRCSGRNRISRSSGVAGSLDAARAAGLTDAAAVDVLLLDIRLGTDSGLRLLLRVASRDAGALPAVIVLTAYDYPQYADAALSLGAAGFVLKTAPLAELVDAIRRVAGRRPGLRGPATADRPSPPHRARARRRPARGRRPQQRRDRRQPRHRLEDRRDAPVPHLRAVRRLVADRARGARRPRRLAGRATRRLTPRPAATDPAATMVPCRTSRSRVRCPVRAVAGPPTRSTPSSPADVASPDIIEASGIRWIHIESPRTADRDWLEANFEFHPLDYEDVYSRNNRPKLDQYDDYVFIVLHFPMFEKDTGRMLTAELDLFMGPDYLITLPNIPLPPLTAMFERYREKEDLREATFSKGSGYLLYKIVDTCVDASFPMLRKMAVKLDRIEDDIFEGRSSEIVRDISEAKQEIINFRRIVRPQRAVLRDLERTKQRYLQEELEIYFDDISDAAERIWDTLENYKEVIEALESTNESVLSHRLNDSFRILTAASVVLLPLTLIASIFGMNVPVPGRGPGVRVHRDPAR